MVLWSHLTTIPVALDLHRNTKQSCTSQGFFENFIQNDAKIEIKIVFLLLLYCD